jgi:predicted O-methyltransferase YrrM
MAFTPQQVWDAYRRDPNQDMYAFSPFLRHHAHGNILEIGVRGGVSTAAFLLGLEKRGGHLYSVDVNAECGKLFDHSQWTFILSDSADVRRIMAHIDRPPDVVLIDGDHKSPRVDEDLNNYIEVISPSGMMLVHDIAPEPGTTDEMIAQGWPGEDVRAAYHRLIVRSGFPHFELPGRFGLGVIYVP